MAKVRNLTSDDLGWQGLRLPAGQVVDVPEGTALEMVGRHPGKFSLEPEAPLKQAQDGPQAPRSAPPGRKRR